MDLPVKRGKPKILDFDIENSPLTYYAPDYPTARITAIASQFIGDTKSLQVLLLGELDDKEILEQFLEQYNKADMVTGHYIRKHDLPIINGSLLEWGLPMLAPKPASDTKLDLVNFTAIPKNQEFLEAVMGTPIQKVQMTQADWRDANRLTQTGLAKTRKRVVSDVKGHIQMRAELIRRNLLKPPVVWPGGK